jgi:predicted nucleic acid-binding protein
VPELLWDASALAKRYAVELGSDTVDALFGCDPTTLMVTTYLGYAEVCATQRRNFNRGTFDLATFTKARSSLRSEVILAPGFQLMTVDDEAILTAVTLIDRHNLNASDAAILAAYCRYARTSGGRLYLYSHRVRSAAPAGCGR